MISASDVLHIISEIHQYSMLLIELKEPATLGILHSVDDRMVCFKLSGMLNQPQRSELVNMLYLGNLPKAVKTLALDDFLKEIEGKKARHIWLETGGSERKEHAFVSISELKAFLRSRAPR